MSLLPGRKRLRALRRSPKIFIPAVSGRQIVVPFRPFSLVLIIFLSFLSFFLFLRSDIFQVKALEFEFEEVSDEALVRQRITEEVISRSIFFLDPSKVEQKIKDDFPTIRAISLEKKLPDRLLIQVAVRVPLAIVEDGGKNHFLVDGEGLLFRQASGEELPVIKLGEDFAGEVGFQISEQGVTSYLETLGLAEQKGLKTVAIFLRSTTVELRLKKTVVWLDVEKGITAQMELLTQLLQRYKLSGRTPKSVDLRFSRPVVRL